MSEESSSTANLSDESEVSIARPHSEQLAALKHVLQSPARVAGSAIDNLSLGAWLQSVINGGAWPTSMPDGIDWDFAKCHLRDAVALWREAGAGVGWTDAEQRDVHELVRAFGGYGAISALNSREAESPDAEPLPRFPIDADTKRRTLQHLLDGWQPASKDMPVPPLSHLLLGSDVCALGMIGSRLFYIGLLDCILDDARDIAKIPPMLSCHLAEPVVVSRNAGVRFRIYFHRREATFRETVSGAFSRGNGGERTVGRREFWALRDISLSAYPGEIMGVIGRNGSGKTTFLKTLAGILTPDAGSVTVRGRVGCLLSFGVGFNAHLSGRENVFLNGSILGLSEREINARLDQIIAFSELGEFIDAPVRTYSAGMRGRLGFSIAIHIDPDILILDEVLTVGDDYFQKKAGSILDRFRQANKTVIIASHSMDLIRKVSTRAVWLDLGRVRMVGDPSDVTRAYVTDCREQREGVR